MKKETINQRIAKYRRFVGYTQAQMAEMLNINASTYAGKERNGKIDCEMLIEISRILEVGIDILLFGVGGEDSPDYTKDYSPLEENIISILRCMPKNVRQEIIEFINIKYKENRKKSR